MGRGEVTMGCGDSNDKDKEVKNKKDLNKENNKDAAKAEQQAASEPAPAPAGNQQPVSQPQQPLVSLTPAADTSEPIVQEKFKNEMLLKQLYEATTNSCGKYMMPHFAAHIEELRFTSVTNSGCPSYHKNEQLEAFEKAGGSAKVDEVTGSVFANGDFENDGIFVKESFLKFFELRDQVVHADEDVLKALIADKGRIEYLHEGSPLRTAVAEACPNVVQVL